MEMEKNRIEKINIFRFKIYIEGYQKNNNLKFKK